MSKIIKWVNISCNLEPGDYTGKRLSRVFKVLEEKVCDVTCAINNWLTKEAVKKGREVPFYWQNSGNRTETRSGLWSLLVGDLAGGERLKDETSKTMRRYETNLKRMVAIIKLKGLTRGAKKRLLNAQIILELSIKTAVEAYGALPKSDVKLLVDDAMKPYKKQIQELFDNEE